MKILRYRQDLDSHPTWGWLSEEKIGVLDGTPFGPYQRKEALVPLDQVQLLPPVSPGKIVCVGRNYVAHAAEHDAEVPR
jgi:2-keto-4-pentenoate hydratase/2-oxohepta-3-ene-1,7-dioic acid hydratase in catechol pathway